MDSFRVRKALGVLVVILLCSSYCYCQESWISLDTNSGPFAGVETQLTLCEEDSLVFRLKIPGISIDERVVDGEIFHRVAIPRERWLKSPGKPMLPEVSIAIATPEFDDLRCEYHVAQRETLSGYRVYPCPREVIKASVEPASISEEFYLDTLVYHSDITYPSEIVKTPYVGRIRDQRVVYLAVCPVQYNCKKAELEMYKEIEIRLIYSNPSPSLAKRGTGPFEEICERILLGYKETHPDRLPSLLRASPGSFDWADDLDDCISDKTDYLVIAADRFCSGSAKTTLDDFAEFRACSTGYNVSLIPVSKIGSSDDAIRNFIRGLYESRSAEHWWDGHLGFVLLVGDYIDPEGVELVPIHRFLSPYRNVEGVADWFASDNWFACVSDDPIHPALMIGRLCVDDSTELENAVAKTLSYEPIPEADWSRNVFFTAGTPKGDDSTDFEEHLQATKAVIPESEFTTSALRGYRKCPSPEGCEFDLAQENADSLNKGRFFVHYVGHGDPCEMGYYPPRSFTTCSAANLTSDSL